MLSFSQTKDSITTKIKKQDSLKNQQSKGFYKNVQNKSNSSKFTKMLHDLMFEPVDPSDQNANKTIEEQLQRNFKSFQGKTIRKIHITTLNPFGYTEKDTTVTPQRKIDKYGNALHSKSKDFTIKGLIVFKEGTVFDSLSILESERLLRRRQFIRRALIQPKIVEENPDMVDVYVTVLDSWSIAVNPDISGSTAELRLREFSFLGLGHRVTAAYKKGFGDEDGSGYTMGYRAQNLYNTYINAEISRDVDVDGTYNNLIQVDRNFYSPYTRWAGKIGLEDRYDKEDIYLSEQDTTLIEPLKHLDFDVWGGYAIPIANKNSSTSLPTNAIFAARYAHRYYRDKPDESIDSVSYFSNINMWLGSIGIRHINFVRDRYIFRNGDIEDIAVGSSFFVHSGYQQHPNGGNYYVGAEAIFADYYKRFGYLAANIGYGGYFSNEHAKQSVINVKTTYFSPVFSIGSLYLRQFAKYNMVVGINRKEIIKDRISLNDPYGIQGFESNEVYGTRKFVFSFQTQSYVPFNWLGFRTSPFVNFDLGFIGSAPDPFFKNEAFTKIGFGVLISNDYFVFENIKLSFFFFPKIPDDGSRFRFSGTRDNQFNLQNYDYQPPHIIEYR